jgi:hypothetical protein
MKLSKNDRGKNPGRFVYPEARIIAVLQLLYTEATAAEWLFPQEKATLHGLKRATSIGELL